MSEADLGADDFTESFATRITTQDYTRRPRIEGVKLVDLRVMNDDGGSFAEIVRLNEDGCLEAFPEFKVRQSSYSQVLPGAVKAFHLHFRQEDVWFVPPSDRLLVGLFDPRKESSSGGASMRIVLGAGKAQLLYIPRGVAHGVANLWSAPGTVLYFVSQQFSSSDPDERRLPFDILGGDFWSITPG